MDRLGAQLSMAVGKSPDVPNKVPTGVVNEGVSLATQQGMAAAQRQEEPLFESKGPIPFVSSFDCEIPPEEVAVHKDHKNKETKGHNGRRREAVIPPESEENRRGRVEADKKQQKEQSSISGKFLGMLHGPAPVEHVDPLWNGARHAAMRIALERKINALEADIVTSLERTKAPLVLADVMQVNTKLHEDFMQFCKSTRCNEQVEFLLEAAAFKASPTDESAKKLAASIGLGLNGENNILKKLMEFRAKPTDFAKFADVIDDATEEVENLTKNHMIKDFNASLNQILDLQESELQHLRKQLPRDGALPP